MCGVDVTCIDILALSCAFTEETSTFCRKVEDELIYFHSLECLNPPLRRASEWITAVWTE